MDSKLRKDFKLFARDFNLGGVGVDQYIDKVYSPKSMTNAIIEERQTHFSAIDVFTRLMMDRIMFLDQEVSDYVASILQAQMLFLENADPRADIQLYINSPGGSVYAGLGIYDVMQYIKPDVNTICTGIAASMAAVLLAAGAHGKRTGLRHSRVMIHQPMGGAGGQASDVAISVNEIIKLKKELYDIISEHSGAPFDKVKEDSERDFWMTAPEAKAYGLIDDVLISNTKKLKTDEF